VYKEPIFSMSRTNGCSLAYSSGRIRGALTADRGRSPPKMERTWEHTSVLTLFWASWVDAPRCGVAITFGWAINLAAEEDAEGGSVVKTSMPAPAI